MNAEVPRKDIFQSQKIKRGFYTGVTLSLLLCGITLWFNLREVSAQKNNVAKVMIAVPVKGEHGQSVVNGALLAFDDFRTVNGRKVVPVVVDTGNSSGVSVATQEVATAHSAAADRQVMAYIGPLDDENVQAVTPILNTSYVVNVPVASAQQMQQSEQSSARAKLFPTHFRSTIRVMPNEIAGEHALVNVMETLKLQDIVIVSNDEPQDNRDARISYIAPSKITPASLKKSAGVYFDLSPNDPNLATVLKQFTDSSIPLIFNAEFDHTSQIFITGQQLANPIYVITLGGNEAIARRDAPEFTSRFNEKYDTDPDTYALAGYDAAAAIIEIMRNTSSVTRGAYMTALAQLSSFTGSYQKMFLNIQGEVKNNTVTLYRVNDESFDYITSYIYEHE